LSDILSIIPYLQHDPIPPTEQTSNAATPAAEVSEGVVPLLLSEEDLASVLALTVQAVHRLHARGRMPGPVRLGTFERWRLAEIEAWVVAGCPDRKNWAWPEQGLKTA
jgi:predicted DNA-binding transcriptional regulator AlpA